MNLYFEFTVEQFKIEKLNFIDKFIEAHSVMFQVNNVQVINTWL